MVGRRWRHMGRRISFLFLPVLAALALGGFGKAYAENLFTVNAFDAVYAPYSDSLTGTTSAGSSSSLAWYSAGFGWSGSIGLTNAGGRIVGIITTAANDRYVLSTKGGGNALIGASCTGNATVCVTLTPGASQSLYNAVNTANGGNGIAAGDIILLSAADIFDILGATPHGDNQAFNGGFQTAYDRIDTVLNLLDDRLNGYGTGTLAADAQTGMSAGNGGAGRSAWGQFFGQTANQTGSPGFNARTAGFAMGADTDRLVDNAVIGLAVSYGRSLVSVRDAETTHLAVDSYQLSLYGDYDLGNGNFLRGVAGFGFDTDDNTRHDAGGTPGLTAKGDYNTREYSLALEAGHHYALGKTMVTPGVVAHYLGYDADSYTETGAGASNRHVSSKYQKLLEVGPTVEAAWNYRNPDGSHIRPAVHAGYRYDLIGDSIDTTVESGGAFQTFGVSPARSRFNLGADATFYTTQAWAVKASYDVNLRRNYIANAAMVRATYHF